MSGGKRHLRVRAGGKAFLFELDQIAFVSRIRSDGRVLRFPKRDVPLTSLAWLLGLSLGSGSEAVVVEVGEDYRALAVDDAEIVDDPGDDEILDLATLFVPRKINPETSAPPR